VRRQLLALAPSDMGTQLTRVGTRGAPAHCHAVPNMDGLEASRQIAELARNSGWRPTPIVVRVCVRIRAC
jgi:CheY-like chemotaxis protein